MKSGIALLLASAISALAQAPRSRAPRFEDYPVINVYHGQTKAPDFGNAGGTDSRCFGGDLDAGFYARKQVNFAGHFVIDACSCGSGCHYLFMWDAASGKFYQNVPPGVINVGPYARRGVQPPGIIYKGEEYQADSNLLIVEGCVEDTCDCAARYYRWTGSQFKLILAAGSSTGRVSEEIVR